MFRRIRWRLLAAYLVVILLALSFLGVHLARDSEARYLAQVETSLLAQARLIAVHVRDAVASQDRTRTQAAFLGTQYPGNPSVIIVGRSQDLLVDYAANPALRVAGSVRREGLLRALAGHEASGSTAVNGIPVVYGAVPVLQDGSVLGAVYVALPLVELAAQLQHIRTFVGWTVLITLLWAAAVSLLLAQRIAGPIQEMRAATARMAAGELGQRVPVRTADELGDLARSLNYMATELERLDAMRREFVADASHELRTPVANLIVAVEALRAELPASNTAAPLIDAIEREVERLRVLVENLLDLSAIESGQVRLRLVPTDIAQVAHGMVESFRGRAAQASIALDYAGPGRGLSVRADPDRMSQVLGNLVDNALKFTPRGGRVSVSVTDHRGAIAITVDDTGPGIPPDDLPHIFDRFFKADRSRSGHRGAGLGLAIAKRLMTAQGGEIRAEHRPGGGARFVVTLAA
ncbi:MAG TPA: ATP-binding protein [bacterium]|nr:ATP-binding protein [bacterium]